MLQIMENFKDSSIDFIHILPTVQQMLGQQNQQTAKNALIWMRHLLENYSEKLSPSMNEIIDCVTSLVSISSS